MQVGDIARSGLARLAVAEPAQSSALHGTVEAARIRHDVAAARDVARSALTNERFRQALEQLASPALSDALTFMRNDGGGSTDLRSAENRYRESSSD